MESFELFFPDNFPHIDVAVARNCHKNALQEGSGDDVSNGKVSTQKVTPPVLMSMATKAFIHDAQSVDKFFATGFNSIMRVSLVQSKHSGVDVIGEELDKQPATSNVGLVGREDVVSVAAVFASQILNDDNGLDQFGVAIVQDGDLGRGFRVRVQRGIHLLELLILVLQVHLPDGERQLLFKQGNPRSLGCTSDNLGRENF